MKPIKQDNRLVSRILSEQWYSMAEEEQDVYKKQATLIQRFHKYIFPDFVYVKSKKGAGADNNNNNNNNNNNSPKADKKKKRILKTSNRMNDSKAGVVPNEQITAIDSMETENNIQTSQPNCKSSLLSQCDGLSILAECASLEEKGSQEVKCDSFGNASPLAVSKQSSHQNQPACVTLPPNKRFIFLIKSLRRSNQ